MKHPGMINSVINDDKNLFEWSEANFLQVKKIITKYPPKKQQSAVIPLLDIAQRQNKGWLNKNALEKVAETLSMSFIRVLEVATFYSMFNLEPVGKNYIQICRTTPCWLRGSNKLLEVAKEQDLSVPDLIAQLDGLEDTLQLNTLLSLLLNTTRNRTSILGFEQTTAVSDNISRTILA